MAKVLVNLPDGLLLETDFIARSEHRNRSDLIREALRRYNENFRRSSFPSHPSEPSEPPKFPVQRS